MSCLPAWGAAHHPCPMLEARHWPPWAQKAGVVEEGGRLAVRNLVRRLAELERRLGAHSITVWMADGTTYMVSSRRLLDMVGEAGADAMKDDTRAVLDSVSDNCLESGCGRMIEAIKAMAVGAAQLAELDPERLGELDATE